MSTIVQLNNGFYAKIDHEGNVSIRKDIDGEIHCIAELNSFIGQQVIEAMEPVGVWLPISEAPLDKKISLDLYGTYTWPNGNTTIGIFSNCRYMYSKDDLFAESVWWCDEVGYPGCGDNLDSVTHFMYPVAFPLPPEVSK